MEKIDDRDGSIVFSKPALGQDWSQLGSPQNTTSLTQTKGANAKLNFYGTSISVYGSVAADSADSGTTSEYIIDGGIGATYTTSPTEEMQHQVKFFQSTNLSPGQHTLEVINETEGGWLLLDFFLVTNSTINSASSTNSVSHTLSSTSSRPTSTPITTTFIPTPTADTDPSVVHASSTSNHKGSDAGIIVGSVLGGIVGLILLIFIWFICRKSADRLADEATAIPNDAPIPVSTSKATQSFALAHRSRNPRTNTGHDISVKTDAVARVPHQYQQPYQQHNRCGSNASASSDYPFRRSITGTARSTHHPNTENASQRGQAPAPSYFGTPQQYEPQQHGRQHPSCSGTPSLSHSHSPSTSRLSISERDPPQHGQGANFGVCGPGSTSIANGQAGYEYHGQRDNGIVPHTFSRDASLLAYPEIPPGLSGPRT